MTKIITATAIVLALTACAGPRTVLQNPDTKQIADCHGSGGSWMVGGLIGMSIEHDRCVEQYRALGFVEAASPGQATRRTAADPDPSS